MPKRKKEKKTLYTFYFKDIMRVDVKVQKNISVSY